MTTSLPTNTPPLDPPESNSHTLLPGTTIIGSGYHVLHGYYADRRSCTKSLFHVDRDGHDLVHVSPSRAFLKPRLVAHAISREIAYSTSVGQTAAEFHADLNSRTALEGDYRFFSGSVEADFGKTAAESARLALSRVQHTFQLYTLELPPTDECRAYLHPEVTADLDTMPPHNLFDAYGTHYLSGMIMGGRTVYMSSTNKGMDYKPRHTLDVVAKAAYQATMDYLSAEDQAGYDSSIQFFTENSTVRLTTAGGISELGNKLPQRHKAWIESINDHAAFVDFVDGRGLRPLWLLASTDDRREELHQAYLGYCQDKQVEYRINDGPYLRAKIVPLVSLNSSAGSWAWKRLAACTPDFVGNWYCLGQIALPGKRPSGYTIIVQELVKGSVLGSIKEWEKVWDDTGRLGFKHYSLWRGQPSDPANHVVLSDFFRSGRDGRQPPTSSETFPLRSVHSKCCVRGLVGSKVWDDVGMWAWRDGSVWEVAPQDESEAAFGSSTQRYYVSGDSIRNPPKRDVWVLKKSALLFVEDFAPRRRPGLPAYNETLPEEEYFLLFC